jgi:hypothetical protein
MSATHSDRATIRAVHPPGRLCLRGSAGLDWQRDSPPQATEGGACVFELEIAHGETVEIKVVRGDGAWMTGRNVVIGCGDRVELHPAFERENGRLEASQELGGLRYRVMLPPSYDEQPALRYPILYVVDGQSVWSDGTDPFGVWGIDHALNALWDIGALAEILVDRHVGAAARQAGAVPGPRPRRRPAARHTSRPSSRPSSPTSIAPTAPGTIAAAQP